MEKTCHLQRQTEQELPHSDYRSHLPSRHSPYLGRNVGHSVNCCAGLDVLGLQAFAVVVDDVLRPECASFALASVVPACLCQLAYLPELEHKPYLCTSSSQES